jgi:hypothetical protein
VAPVLGHTADPGIDSAPLKAPRVPNLLIDADQGSVDVE